MNELLWISLCLQDSDSTYCGLVGKKVAVVEVEGERRRRMEVTDRNPLTRLYFFLGL